MKLLFIIPIAFFACCCSCPDMFVQDEKSKLCNEVLHKTASKLKREKNLVPCGTGGQIMDEVKKLTLHFDYYKTIDISEARKLLIVAAEDLIATINATEKLRPYLIRYPCNEKNVEIAIFLEAKTKKTGDLEIVTFEQGILKYKIHTESPRKLQTILTETYDEALEKLKESSAAEPAPSS